MVGDGRRGTDVAKRSQLNESGRRMRGAPASGKRPADVDAQSTIAMITCLLSGWKMQSSSHLLLISLLQSVSMHREGRPEQAQPAPGGRVPVDLPVRRVRTAQGRRRRLQDAFHSKQAPKTASRTVHGYLGRRHRLEESSAAAGFDWTTSAIASPKVCLCRLLCLLRLLRNLGKAPSILWSYL